MKPGNKETKTVLKTYINGNLDFILKPIFTEALLAEDCNDQLCFPEGSLVSEEKVLLKIGILLRRLLG